MAKIVEEMKEGTGQKKLVTIYLDGREVKVPEGVSILEACNMEGIKIPTLCYFEGLTPWGGCRICMVEVEGQPNLVASCVTDVREGMKIKTSSKKVREARKTNLELLLSNHPLDCQLCDRNGSCELQDLSYQFGVREIRFPGEKKTYEVDRSSPSIKRDANRCILCGRCIRACQEIQAVFAIDFANRGFDSLVSPSLGLPLGESVCVNCGQCILACPTGALSEVSHVEMVWEALEDPEKFVILQTAPAIRVSIGEPFGLPPGTVTTGKMVAAFRRLGFDRVFDTNFAADLTIIEEGTEFINRLQKGGKLPLITSCSPGWIKFMEHFYPELMENVSTCKSPQQMFGAVAKTYYAQKLGIDPQDMVVVSIMPCTAKKFECQREEMKSSGCQDVDYSLTTREAARMLKEKGIDLREMPEEEFDDPLGISTGAAAVFGATGGVMEAALRSVYEIVSGKTLESLDFYDVRGMEGVKEATVNIDGLEVGVAVAHSLGNARKILDQIKEGNSKYHFIEIMACPGGCIGGGGQPIPTDLDIRMKRIEAIYQVDKNLSLRKSHENPAIKQLYEEFLGEPNGEKAHQLLHTHYLPREKM
ncbi:NADH-dependent [FeFe] hydrogenase, group A6 [Candidatus Sordicultor fermentans]|jgi:NADH-quinone oxidoreductase subunit G/NADP-reducing hydrogenase subunit HndD|uniref:NADH-dependent [FeFe] hydrogenase, group A6 n=1 Tax=Candidatus Sordicultor fermentans TaxID=1953203 RepID=UPI00169E87D1|nr:NADH-dependent [FeFe] hydrogenase, group A6 [Atribacterota bacterium]NLY05530.1 2Fe-2S iron-sulfur cluster binding domain-containing protein [Candidatus Atribacteria bacterium]MDI9607845.1 NADH-dependent [FeFe] hydrogenase, group A6 [Atribacterota bacterium]MDY0134954.1 NADH-dependent [FeFe] hydrogenase, group A6 [Atribacterota bacterium]HOQ50264.1 NADH-dependent [FeFe] hydrogenase, group A6 [Candidatus Atribacteria bacterium]